MTTTVPARAKSTAIDVPTGPPISPEPELNRLLEALRAVRDGDFRARLRSADDGLMGEIASTFNDVVERNRHLAKELDRVRRVVGRDGRLTERLTPSPGEGAWADAVTAANTLVDDLVRPTIEVGRVLSAVAEGDLSHKIDLRFGDQSLRGEFLRMARTVNGMVDRLSAFTSEVTRVAREVGTEGKLGGQARVRGVSGSWKDLTDSVNVMANNLTSQVRDIAQVTTAVARGDLSRKVTVAVSGELSELKDTVNTMVDQLSGFAAEVTRVAREVGTDGRLGGQAMVPGVAGTWKDLTDSVNSMARNLTAQVRDIAQVATAVARGDLSKKITVDVEGELLELKSTVNTMVDQLSGFADEVTRVAREVGTEGKLGGQAVVHGVSGTWRDLTDSVNVMGNNLTSQVRNIAQVTTAVAQGDLSQKIAVDARGEIAELKSTINTMVDQLSAFADEVTRVAREVGTEGNLGGQAQVPGVAGTWRDLTESVNVMANNLTGQVRGLAQVATAVARGDLSQKITVDARGEIAELKSTINTMVDQLSAFADEVTRVAREVGTEGDLGGQAQVPGVAGTWRDLTESVNVMANNLTSQVRNIAQVTTAVARGDLSQKITVDARGEIAELKSTINTMVDQLSAFADEVTRVAHEVGTEGNLGGQAQVPNVAGTWKGLTDSVNSMAFNLTSQVRNIALVTTAVARGDLSQKITVDARGEILELKTTINTMVDQLSAFASEVTRVAREVGSEGRLGGQAEVAGVSGTWKRLTESVNELAGNLTSQVRAIAKVATAVTLGDLTRQVTVDASGEVAELKDNINQMIANLRETTRANQEQDWLKTNLARVSSLMQGRRDLLEVAQLIMNELTPVVDAQRGAFFLADRDNGATELTQIAGYAHDGTPRTFRIGESLVGQAALERKRILVTDAPGDYIPIRSGLGSAAPSTIVVLPVLFEDQALAVIELASFRSFNEIHLDFLDQLMEIVGVTVNTIMVNSRTEDLLTESQRLAQELQERSEQLQSQQEELRNTNTELEEKAALLAEQNRAIEVKNVEIEQARRSLEDRAEQLAVSSRYKTEFLANMSHELRTPLNSLLILARLLGDNPTGNLTPKQVEFAHVIHSAGSDLLQLINDILDLSKVEAGKMDINPSEVTLEHLVGYFEATFRPLTAEKGLRFVVTTEPGLPETLRTDEQRLQQVLRNLLSNAVKFTESGEVRLAIGCADDTHAHREPLLSAARAISFSVTDTGIGIPREKLSTIFEAFQQADGTTNREYGGTGLGLSISREIARLIGGEIHASSLVGEGSTFTLCLPERLPPVPAETEQGAEADLESATAAPMPRQPSTFGTPLRVKGVEPVVTGPANKGDSSAERTARPRRPVTPQPITSTDRPERTDRAESARFDEVFGGRQMLIVDDDVRNVFALTSAFEQHGMSVLYAENGHEAISTLNRNPDVDLVLMDIMMPGMDGYATMEMIRMRPEFAALPIIALTAKAMKGDREKTIAAGASDYVTKPVEVEHLLRVIEGWLAR